MDALFVVGGISLAAAGFVRFGYLMHNSARYSPNEGGTQVLIATIAIGAGIFLALWPMGKADAPNPIQVETTHDR